MFTSAALSAPNKKKAAQAIVAAQIKNKPLAGPTAKKAIRPASKAILVERAVNLSMVFNPNRHLSEMGRLAFILRCDYES
jgi:hypothetical protein